MTGPCFEYKTIAISPLDVRGTKNDEAEKEVFRQKYCSRKEKRAHLAMDPLYLVRLAGIEPTTPWFVAKYSIQLSYSREK